MSVQQRSSTTSPAGHPGEGTMDETEEVSTTRRTPPASLAARRTFSVPWTAGTISWFCNQGRGSRSVWARRALACGTQARVPGGRRRGQRCRGRRGGRRPSSPARRRGARRRRGGRTGTRAGGPRRLPPPARGGGPSPPCHLHFTAYVSDRQEKKRRTNLWFAAGKATQRS
jgi:hypothetical protein